MNLMYDLQPIKCIITENKLYIFGDQNATYPQTTKI